MKEFWLKLNLRTKVIFIFFIFVIFLSFVGFANYKPTEPTNTTDNSEFIDKITNLNPILSYPVSYTNEWTGRITLVPVRARELEYTASSTTQCTGIIGNMDVYYTPTLDSIMIITNKNLQKTETDLLKFNTAKDIIIGIKDFESSNAELNTFQTYCSYFTLYKIDELNNTYVGTDSSRSILGLGLRKEDYVDNISNVGLYIYVYGVKDDNLIQLSRSLQGSFIFSQSNWELCRTKALQKDQNECLSNLYESDLSMRSKIESEALNLISEFKLIDEAE